MQSGQAGGGCIGCRGESGQASRGRESAGGSPRVGVRGWESADGSPWVGQRVCIACLAGPGLWLCAGVCPPHPRPLSPVSRGRGGLSVARAFQPEICPVRLDARRLPPRGVGAGGWPYAKPRRGTHKVGVRCLVRRAADGSPRVGQRVCIACRAGPGL